MFKLLTYSELVGTSGLASVTPANDANVLLEERSVLAVVKILGLGDPEVLLSVADFVSLGTMLNFLIEFLFLLLPLLLQFQRPVLGQLVDGVGSLAVSKKGLLSGGEVGDVLVRLQRSFRLVIILSVLLLNVVGVNLSHARSSDVQLDLGKERPLDVGDRLGLRGFNEEGLNNSTLHVNQEGLFQVGLEMAGNLRFLNSMLGLAALVQSASL